MLLIQHRPFSQGEALTFLPEGSAVTEFALSLISPSSGALMLGEYVVRR